MHLKIYKESRFHVVCSSHTHTHTHSKGTQETLRDGGHAWYLESGDGITDTCICPNASECIY